MTYKTFDELGTSTKTVMVYSNVQFNFEKLFESLPITEVDVPLTKKKKLPDMKKVKAPRGAIISLRYKNKFRGIVTKAVSDKKSTYFLNQVTCILSLGNKNLHIMMFKNKLKIAGNKDTEQAYDTVKLLWDHIQKIENGYNFLDKNPPRFIFDVVMTNVDFKLGFQIDRRKLNNLMNSSKYRDFVYMSRFETTGNTNVNIKLYCKKPPEFSYKCLTIDKNKPSFSNEKDNIYNDKKKQKPKYTTFLVFRSSKVIESGCYNNEMRIGYEKFINIIKENKEQIEEKITITSEPFVSGRIQKFYLRPLLQKYKTIKELPSNKMVAMILQQCPEKCPECSSMNWWERSFRDSENLACGECKTSIFPLSKYYDSSEVTLVV